MDEMPASNSPGGDATIRIPRSACTRSQGQRPVQRASMPGFLSGLAQCRVHMYSTQGTAAAAGKWAGRLGRTRHLRGAGDHVLDEVAVTRRIDDGEEVLLSLHNALNHCQTMSAFVRAGTHPHEFCADGTLHLVLVLTSNFHSAMSMVIPRSRSALSLSRTQAYLNEPLPVWRKRGEVRGSVDLRTGRNMLTGCATPGHWCG